MPRHSSRGNIGRLDLLVALGHDVVVPPAVLHEVEQGGGGSLPAELTVLDAAEPAATVLMWGLGEGETHVLRNPGTEAILDDLAARRCASALGIPIRGTVGLVVLAKRRGLVAAVRPILGALGKAGFYLAPTVVEAALRSAGEA